MKIAFYAPFKPLGHDRPSGDLAIAGSLYRYFSEHGHDIQIISRLRTRWIFQKPWLWPLIIREYKRSCCQVIKNKPDIWLTYHTYYKAPDILGPMVSKKTSIPYVIFQGIYSTKRRRHLTTLPGYILNKTALCSAAHTFTNRQDDLVNLKRLLLSENLSYSAPGIFPDDFTFDPDARTKLRQDWGVGNDPVVLSAAMFRPDVKTQGLEWLIQSCGRLFRKGINFHLIIAGDGKERKKLENTALEYCQGKVKFVGKIPREKMYRFYSAGDIFAFPGIRESLGMVFLESQSCSLPVIAFDNGGIPEVVKKGDTGFLVPLFDVGEFDKYLYKLIVDRKLCLDMGRKAGEYVRKYHDLNHNYKKVEIMLQKIIRRSNMKSGY